MTPTFAAVGLVTADLPASLAFYRRLGLDIPSEADGQPHVEAALTEGVRLLWDTVETVRTVDPDWTPPSGPSRAALAFDCGTADEVDKVHADLVAAGYHSHRAPWDAFWGQRYAVVHDPDGNGVDLFAALG